MKELLGKSFAGVLISDDFSSYNGYPVAAQQKCLAHLLTVIQSCRAQGRSVLGFLRQALVCTHHPVAQVVSLIPGDGGDRSSLFVNPLT